MYKASKKRIIFHISLFAPMLFILGVVQIVSPMPLWLGVIAGSCVAIFSWIPAMILFPLQDAAQPAGADRPLTDGEILAATDEIIRDGEDELLRRGG